MEIDEQEKLNSNVFPPFFKFSLTQSRDKITRVGTYMIHICNIT